MKNPTAPPKALVAHTASFADALGRSLAFANYETDGGTALTRSATMPAAMEDEVLVSLTAQGSAENTAAVFELLPNTIDVSNRVERPRVTTCPNLLEPAFYRVSEKPGYRFVTQFSDA